MSARPQARAVFLDRDGVINRTFFRGTIPVAPQEFKDFEVLPGVVDAVMRLKAHGYKVIVVTNQPDVGRGIQTAESLEQMHAHIQELMEFDAIQVCPHDDADLCHCRKPKPGMLLDAAKRFNIDLKASFMVGDRWRDVDAGVAAGCRTFFVNGDYEERKPENPDWTVRSLAEAAEIILGL